MKGREWTKCGGSEWQTADFELDILSEEQAIDQLELIGNDFYIYRNNQTNLVNVIYKREDGNYGLIETR